MDQILFYAFASIVIFSIFFMIIAKNPVTSAIFLVVSFFGLAGLYAQLEAHFIATLQILVYAGAIMVLFIFVIMLLNLKDNELTSGRINFYSILGVLAGFAVFGFLGLQFVKLPLNQSQNAGVFTPVTSDFGTVKNIGNILFTQYAIPMQFIGILLLVGIVGAILLGRREEA